MKIKVRCEELVEELEIHKCFSGKKGIWPLLGSFQYKKRISKSEKIAKVTFFTPMAYGNLSKIAKGKVSLAIDHLIDIADQLVHGLHCLHSDGFIHGDLKVKNALFSFLQGGGVVSGLIDYGRSFNPSREEDLPFPFNQGIYGSRYVTAPELFGNEDFKDDLFKVDIWALGFLFHMIFLKKIPIWHTVFGDDGKLEILTDQDPEWMHDRIKKTIEKERESLEVKEKLSLEEKCTLLIYDMMRLDPTLRPDTEMIMKRIAALKEKNTMDLL